MPVYPVPLNPNSDSLLPPELRMYPVLSDREVKSLPGIAIGVPDLMLLIPGSPKIAYTAWETTRIPLDRRTCLAPADRIWLPSSWCREIFIRNGFDEARLDVVPEGVDCEVYTPRTAPRANGPYRFLYVGTWHRRKGLDLLLRAYTQAFRGLEDVVLQLHTRQAANTAIRDHIAAITERFKCRIELSHALLDSEMPGLYQAADALVLPSRGEGWGLPVTEAMACGLPVITSAHGGPLDFVTTDCGYPVDIEHMVPVTGFEPYDQVVDLGLWAEPSVEDLTAKMQEVYNNQEEASRRGVAARQHVKQCWTWQLAASKSAQLLVSIGA